MTHNGIIDVFMTCSCLLELPGIRTACKGLWEQWSFSIGRASHVEYTLTRPLDIVYTSRAMRRVIPFTSGMSSISWGNVQLYSLAGDAKYIAGLDDDTTQPDYSVNIKMVIIGALRRYKYILVKCDIARKVSVELTYTSGSQKSIIARCIGDGDMIALKVTIAAKVYAFDILYKKTDKCGVIPYCMWLLLPRSGHCERSTMCSIYDMSISKLADFMFTTRLDIVKHLPPLNQYDQILRAHSDS